MLLSFFDFYPISNEGIKLRKSIIGNGKIHQPKRNKTSDLKKKAIRITRLRLGHTYHIKIFG